MYNTGNKQFILRQSTGVLWNFYHDEKQGICYSTLNKRNTWTNPVTLHKNAHQTFYITLDPDDCFHLLYQDAQGNIHYSYLDGDAIKTITVLNSKTPSAYDKHLYLVPFKNNIHFFYVLHHESAYLLAYQALNDGKISNPKVIDYVPDSCCPYSVLYDKSQGIYVFYQSSDGSYMQLGYKKYTVAQKFWSEFISVTKSAGNCEYPRAVIDNSGIIHLCYQRCAPRSYEMVYQQKVPDKNLWTDEIILHSSVHSFENASILWLNKNIIVYWVREDIIYYNLGEQSGNFWGKPQRYNFPSGRQMVCMSYETNNIYESERIIAKDIPGSFVGGLKFAFYQQTSERGDNLSAEELKNLILDSLKLLNASIEELKDNDSSIRDELTRLRNLCQDMEKEVVKYTVRLNFLESGSNKAK